MEALEARQDAILTRLEELKEQVKAYKKSLGLSDLPPPKPVFSAISTEDTIRQRIEKLKRTISIIERLFERRSKCDSSQNPTQKSSRTTQSACVSKTADIVIRCSPSYPAFTLKSIYS